MLVLANNNNVALLIWLLVASCAFFALGAAAQEEEKRDTEATSPVAYILLLDTYLTVNYEIGTSYTLSFAQSAATFGTEAEANVKRVVKAPIVVIPTTTLRLRESNTVIGNNQESSMSFLHDFITVVPSTVRDHAVLQRLSLKITKNRPLQKRDDDDDDDDDENVVLCEVNKTFCVRRVIVENVYLPPSTSRKKESAIGLDDRGKAMMPDGAKNESTSSRRALLNSVRSDSEPNRFNTLRDEHKNKMNSNFYKGVVDELGTVDVVERMDLERGVWPGREQSQKKARKDMPFAERMRLHGLLSRAAEGFSGLEDKNTISSGGSGNRLMDLLVSLSTGENPLRSDDVLEWLSSTSGEGVRVGLFDSGLSLQHEGFVSDGDEGLFLESAGNGDDKQRLGRKVLTSLAKHHVPYCRTFTSATNEVQGKGKFVPPSRYVERNEGTEGCGDGFGHGTFVAGVVGSRGIPLGRNPRSEKDATSQRKLLLQQENEAVAPPARKLYKDKRGRDERGQMVMSSEDWKDAARRLVKEKKTKKKGNPEVRTSSSQKGQRGRQPAKCRGIAPSAQLHVFKTFTDDQISYTSYFLAALNEALQLGLDVINLSMGGYDYEDYPFVEKALELSAAGVTIITAAGNDGPHWGTTYNPADHLDVIGVGAVNYKEQLAKFSSRGMTTWELPFGVGRPKPDVVAFGDPIAGASIQSGHCRSLSGTSMASPVVAGVASLVTSVIRKRRALCDVCETYYYHNNNNEDYGDRKEDSSNSSSASSLIREVCERMKMTSFDKNTFCRRIAVGGNNMALQKQVLFSTSRPLFPFRYYAPQHNGDETNNSRRDYVLGVSSSASDLTVFEHSIFSQGAGLVDARKAVLLASLEPYFAPRLSTFPSDLFLYAHPTSFTPHSHRHSKYEGNDKEKKYFGARLQPGEAQRVADECEYMWPLCAQPRYFTGMPLTANLTVLNSASSVARRRRCYATLRHHAILAPFIGVHVDCSERLWPYVGTAAVSFAVLKPFPLEARSRTTHNSGSEGEGNGKSLLSAHSAPLEATLLLPKEERVRDFASMIVESAKRYGNYPYFRDEEDETDQDSITADSFFNTSSTTVLIETNEYIIVEGTIELEYEHMSRADPSKGRGDKKGKEDTSKAKQSDAHDILTASVPFRIKVLKKTPPRTRRLLWDVSHSIQFPSSYVPRDSIDKSRGGSGGGGEGASNGAASASDFLDWNGDHPYTNYAATFLHLTKRKGYFVDTLASPQGLLAAFPKDGSPLFPSSSANFLMDHALPFVEKKDAEIKLFGHAPLPKTRTSAVRDDNGSKEHRDDQQRQHIVVDKSLNRPPTYMHTTNIFGTEKCDFSSIAARYGALLIADPEDFFTPREVQRVHELLALGDVHLDGDGGEMKSSEANGKGWLVANKECGYVTRGEEELYTHATANSGGRGGSTTSPLVAKPALALVVVSDWYNKPLLSRMGGVDDNTGRYWQPVVGGANVPALNELLNPFGVQLSHMVLEGRLGNVKKVHNSGDGSEKSDDQFNPSSLSGPTPYFASGGTIQSVPLSSQCQWCSLTTSGVGAEERLNENTIPQLGVDAGSDDGKASNPDSLRIVKLKREDPKPHSMGRGHHATLLFSRVSGHGRLSILTDSGCLDMGHHKYYPTSSMANEEKKRISKGLGAESGVIQRRAAEDFAREAQVYSRTFCFDTLDSIMDFSLRLRALPLDTGGEASGEVPLDLRASQFTLSPSRWGIDGSLSLQRNYLSDRNRNRNRQEQEQDYQAILSTDLQCFPCDEGDDGRTVRKRKNLGGEALQAIENDDKSSIVITSNFSSRAYNVLLTESSLPEEVKNKKLSLSPQTHRKVLWNVFKCPFAVTAGSASVDEGRLAYPARCKSIIPIAKKTSAKGGPSTTSSYSSTDHSSLLLPIHFTAADLAKHLSHQLRAMAKTSWVARRRLGMVEADGDDDWDRHRVRRKERDAEEADHLPSLSPSLASLSLGHGGGVKTNNRDKQRIMDGPAGQGRRVLPIVFEEHYEVEEEEVTRKIGEKEKVSEEVHLEDQPREGHLTTARATLAVDRSDSEEKDLAHDRTVGEKPAVGDDPARDLFGAPMDPPLPPTVANENKDDSVLQEPEKKSSAHPRIPVRAGSGDRNGSPPSPAADAAPNKEADSSSSSILSFSNPWLPAIFIFWLLKWYIKIRLLASKRFRSMVYWSFVRLRLLPFFERTGLIRIVRRLGCLPPFGEQPSEIQQV